MRPLPDGRHEPAVRHSGLSLRLEVFVAAQALACAANVMSCHRRWLAPSRDTNQAGRAAHPLASRCCRGGTKRYASFACESKPGVKRARRVKPQGQVHRTTFPLHRVLKGREKPSQALRSRHAPAAPASRTARGHASTWARKTQGQGRREVLQSSRRRPNSPTSCSAAVFAPPVQVCLSLPITKSRHFLSIHRQQSSEARCRGWRIFSAPQP